jgi:hypothetical protein
VIEMSHLFGGHINTDKEELHDRLASEAFGIAQDAMERNRKMPKNKVFTSSLGRLKENFPPNEFVLNVSSVEINGKIIPIKCMSIKVDMLTDLYGMRVAKEVGLLDVAILGTIERSVLKTGCNGRSWNMNVELDLLHGWDDNVKNAR